jgi:hypothetical protein
MLTLFRRCPSGGRARDCLQKPTQIGPNARVAINSQILGYSKIACDRAY